MLLPLSLLSSLLVLPVVLLQWLLLWPLLLSGSAPVTVVAVVSDCCDIGATQVRSFHLNKLTISPLVRQRCDPSAIVSPQQNHYSASSATSVRSKCDHFTSTKSHFRL